MGEQTGNPLAGDHQFYRSFHGWTIALPDFGKNPYISFGDGKFYELHETGYGGGPSFEDPHHDNRKGKIKIEKGCLVLTGNWMADEPFFRPTEPPAFIKLISLPKVRKLLWIYKLIHTDPVTYFVGMGDKYHYSDKTLRIFWACSSVG